MEDELPRTEPASGCLRGIKASAGDTVVEILNISSGTNDAPPTPPMGCKLAIEAPPATDRLSRKVSGDIPP